VSSANATASKSEYVRSASFGRGQPTITFSARFPDKPPPSICLCDWLLHPKVGSPPRHLAWRESDQRGFGS
jgi:hypothetical protein